MTVVLKTLAGKISSTHVFIVIFNTVGLHNSKNLPVLFLHRICFLDTSLLPTLVRSVTYFLSCQTIHICPPFTTMLGHPLSSCYASLSLRQFTQFSCKSWASIIFSSPFHLINDDFSCNWWMAVWWLGIYTYVCIVHSFCVVSSCIQFPRHKCHHFGNVGWVPGELLIRIWVYCLLRITISLVDEYIPHKLTTIQLEELNCRQCGKVAGGARISSELHRPTLIMVSLFPTRSKI